MSQPDERPFGAWMRALHAFDFGHLLPALGNLPMGLGETLAGWRGRARGALRADWRSLALGHRHIAARTLRAYRELAPDADAMQLQAWLRRRFAAESRDEFEARWVAEGRCADLHCRIVPASALQVLRGRQRGLVLLTAHYESFILGIVFLARSGARINAMKSTVTHDPRVARAVSAHFEAKYEGLEQHLNGGRLVDIEAGVRPIYRMLEHGEIVVVLADAPVLPQGARLELPFLGARRPLAGGAQRIAEKTGSDIGAFVCMPSGPRRYTVALSTHGPAADRAAVERAYDFLSQQILRDPCGWWAADLLPDMPALPEPADAVAAASAAPTAGPPAAPPARPSVPHCDVLLLTDSMLAGSAELEFGRAELRRRIESGLHGARWMQTPRASAPTTAALLRELDANDAGDAPRRLLVIRQPALLAAPTLVATLDEALRAASARSESGTAEAAAPAPVCAVAATQHHAGALAPAYVTWVDFETYVMRRRCLPAFEPWSADRHGPPQAYLLDVAAARRALGEGDGGGWDTLPARLGAATVGAPRAYVHDYADYRRHERADMLALLPDGVTRLLDVGGGEGVFAQACVRARGVEAWVLEPDAAAASRARAAGLAVLPCRLNDLGSEHDGGFDAVTLLDVLEHLEEPGKALAQVRRLLRPGGVVLVSTPNVGHWPIVRDLAAGRFDYVPVGSLCWTHLRFFTPQSLRDLLEQAGFHIESFAEEQTAADAGGLERFIASAVGADLDVDRRSLQQQTLRVRARVVD